MQFPFQRSAAAARFTTAAALMLALPTAFGQEAEDLLNEDPGTKLKFLGEGGYTRQGEADIDGGGTLEVNRYDAMFGLRTGLGEQLTWLNTFFVGLSDYEFNDGGFGGESPWDKVLFNRFGTQLVYQIDEHWGVRGGGVFMFSRETDADWNDGFTGGGQAGVDYRFSETLFVSAGLAFVTQIEDSVQVTPSVLLNWQPSEQWVVRVGSVPVSGGAAAAAEVEYDFTEQWEVALGFLYNQRRFRLEDSGVAPDGVGEDNTLPLRVRLGWNITPQVSLNFLAGIVLGGRLQLDDSQGNELIKEDYDPAPYFGVRAVGRF